MKISELKKLLEPMIKNSIKEVLLEEGILSKIVQEAIIGVKSADNVLNESKAQETKKIKKAQKQEAYNKNLETRKKLLNSIGKDNYGGVDLFENTTPMGKTESPYGPLSGQETGDSGVDISSLPGMSKWSKLT